MTQFRTTMQRIRHQASPSVRSQTCVERLLSGPKTRPHANTPQFHRHSFRSHLCGPCPLFGSADLCGEFHLYAYEWTPDYIAWFVDGVEIRRETGEAAAAYRDNATEGMQIRFNIWPGDASFVGNLEPSTVPVHQYINWVQ